MNIRRRFRLNIIAIENGDNVIDMIDPEYVFCENDILYLSGNKDGFRKLSEWTND